MIHSNDKNSAGDDGMQYPELYRCIFEGMCDPILILKDNRFVDCNVATLKMLRYTDKSTFLNQSPAEISPSVQPDGRSSDEKAAEMIAIALRDGFHRFEWVHTRSDGSDVLVEVTLTPVQVQGEVFLHTLWRDIKERKDAEYALAYNNAFLNTLLDAIPVPVFYKDRELRYLGINTAFEQVYSTSRQEMIGKSVHDIAPRELADIYYAKDMELILNPGVQIYESQIKNFQRDEIRDVIFHKATFNDPAGNVLGMIGAVLDITERKKLEQEQLKNEKLESLGILAGGIAHDFNNILTGIRGNVSFAQIFIEETHKAFKPLHEAEKATVRATELAHQLLTFARGGEPVKKLVSIDRLVNETVSLVLRGSNVKGTVAIPASIHAVEADEGQLSQMFHNIIINAVHAMPEGGVVSVSAENRVLADNNPYSLPPGTYVALTFADQGCGMSHDIRMRIFDPYFTTKPTGNGLGLASAHSIVMRHGGHIGVTSEINKGTTFTIILPSTGELFSSGNENFIPESIGESGSGSILVMDDEVIIRDMSSEMLEYLGYEITTCENGEEAIALYRNAMESGAPFRAVIMDLTVPGNMGGKEAAAQILAFDPDACLIVSSGYSHDPIMSKFREYGFSGAVAKPYSVNEFSQLLSTVLSEH